jgi:hypothetical protein
MCKLKSAHAVRIARLAKHAREVSLVYVVAGSLRWQLCRVQQWSKVLASSKIALDGSGGGKIVRPRMAGQADVVFLRHF